VRLSLESTTRGSLRLGHHGGSIDTPSRRGVSGPAGVEEQGIGTSGFSRNLGGPAPLHAILPDGATGYQPLARSCAPWAAGAKRQAQRVVSPSEATRSAARGRQDVGASHSTAEAGEREPRGPWGGKGMPHCGAVRGSQRQDSEPGYAVNGKRADSVAACKTAVRRAGCVNCARPDLRERWEATPTATRPVPANVVNICMLVPSLKSFPLCL
jgi:hypothetical protein